MCYNNCKVPSINDIFLRWFLRDANLASYQGQLFQPSIVHPSCIIYHWVLETWGHMFYGPMEQVGWVGRYLCRRNPQCNCFEIINLIRLALCNSEIGRLLNVFFCQNVKNNLGKSCSKFIGLVSIGNCSKFLQKKFRVWKR